MSEISDVSTPTVPDKSVEPDPRSRWFALRRIDGHTVMHGGTKEEQAAVTAKINNRQSLVDIAVSVQPQTGQKKEEKEETRVPSKNIQTGSEIKAAVRKEVLREAADEGLSPIQSLLKWFTRFS